MKRCLVSYEVRVILGKFTTQELIDEIMSRDKGALTTLVFNLAKEFDKLHKEVTKPLIPKCPEE